VTAPPRCLVVGIDGSDVARRAASWAYVVAAALGARLVVVHARGLLEGAGLQPAVDPAAIVAELAAAQPEAGSPQLDTLVEPGTPPDVLLRVADRVGADLVVVGSRGLGGSVRALGSTSEAVLNRASVPVVVLPGAV
jgi:nucleotide-binding universal stress UspA family protein